ncbi:MAG TPA: carboxypeptidase regulatory-like domain-containing protein, partial [Pyrinomonadaceae bacterium]|nr:carboxypeptidase regulatory-like domain-containing protein [Pyrinomonadaceae bacterium]
MFVLDDRGNSKRTLSLGEADFASRYFQWCRFAAAVFATVILITMICAAVNAQTETGQISGKVTDPQNGVLANASVTVKSTRTAVERTTMTNAEGVYTVTNLQPGTYDVTVSGGGFALSTQRVEVTVGGKSSADVQLSLSEIRTENVTVVSGGGAEINIQDQQLSNLVTATQLRDLPSLTRNPYDFVSLSGNVSTDAGGSTSRGVGVSINGQRAASTDILLDGGENVNTFTATVGQGVPLESVQEYRVITSNFSAEYGRASGGIVNLVTRSGSNQFHGSLFEFNRISALASNSFDNNANGLPKDRFTRNQFGYSFGGPVIKNKLFFFSSTEWTRVRSVQNVINLVPTSELINTSASATRTFFGNYQLATPINGTVYTVGDIVSLVGASNFSATNAFSNLPSTLPAFGQVRFTVPADVGAGSPQNTYQTVNRIDFNLSDKTQIYGRLAIEKNNYFSGTVNYSPYEGFNTGETDFNQNYLVSLTHTFTPRFVSQSKLVFNRLNQLQPLGEQEVGPTLYLTGVASQKLGGYLLSLPGYSQFTPGNAIPFGGPQNLGQFYQDVSYTKGKHQFRFGGNAVYTQDNRMFGAYQNAVEQLGSSVSGGLNNLVLGQLLSFQAAVYPQGQYPGGTLQLPVGPPDFTRSNRYRDGSLYFN